MHLDDLAHQLFVRKIDEVENTPAQEGVRQLLLRVGGDDDHRALLRGDRLLGLRNVELHLIQLPQKIVGELQICLVDLVDQQNHLLLRAERLAQLAHLDIPPDVVHAALAELAVVESLHRVVHVEAILGLGEMCIRDRLRALAAAGLGIIYMGAETGDDEILKYINKGVTSAEIIAAGQKLKPVSYTHLRIRPASGATRSLSS